LLIASCAPEKPSLRYSTEEDLYDLALTYYNEKKYEWAKEAFYTFLLRYPLSDRADDAQFYLAHIDYKLKQFDEAIEEYKFLLENYPLSPYREKALLELARVYFEKSPPPYLDQTDTKNAIRYLRLFLSEYPNSPYRKEAIELLNKSKNKLARKLFLAAMTYKLMEEYEAEKIYLKLLLEEYPESDVCLEAKYELSVALLKTGNKKEAQSYLDEILRDGRTPSHIKEKAILLKKKL